jgi:hypothetical protein
MSNQENNHNVGAEQRTTATNAESQEPRQLIADKFVEITEPSSGVTVSPTSATGPGGRPQPVHFSFDADEVTITFQGVASRVMSWEDWEFIARVYGKRRNHHYES